MTSQPGPASSLSSRVFSWHGLVSLLLMASCVINVLLAQEVIRVREIVRDLRSPDALRIGEAMPPSIVGRTLAGQPVTVRLAEVERPSVLYVVRSGCGWCTRNAANFSSLSSQISNGYSVTVLAIDEEPDALKKYLKETYGGIDAIWDLPSAMRKKFGGTPQTVVVSATGNVTKNWVGAYDGALLAEIEDYFSVTLPGLAPSKRAELMRDALDTQASPLSHKRQP